eukprot:Skav209343  [mRNA]  locus=scaffold241:529899:531991:+ [translate_table: standard]
MASRPLCCGLLAPHVHLQRHALKEGAIQSSHRSHCLGVGLVGSSACATLADLSVEAWDAGRGHMLL